MIAATAATTMIATAAIADVWNAVGTSADNTADVSLFAYALQVLEATAALAGAFRLSIRIQLVLEKAPALLLI
jgi:hypothetical protein